MQTAIDIHSHMLCDEWLQLFKQHGTGKSGARFSIRKVLGGKDVIHAEGVPFMTPTPGMFDYKTRFAAMDEAGVGMAVLSLTGPNVYWGDADASTRAARAMNDSFSEAQRAYPERIRWLCSLPMQFPDRALAELERSIGLGALGVMVLANIGGAAWTEPQFAPVWAELDRRKLPVFMHPTVPCGADLMGMADFQLSASVGFPFDSTMAVSRMIFAGFFDRYPNLKLVVAHGGGTLPFLSGRLDRCWEILPSCREFISQPPSEYLKRIYADTALYSREALRDTIETFGGEHVMYGTDFPHTNADMAPSLARINELPPALRDNVRGRNALRVFGI
ncbi:MAG: amidohydrolase [Candidatus Parcubacteria bacterium]|nr:amidohydrolase [Burkholderiales bacterium]